jgi:adenylylsulfate kinase-like enzyme
MNSFYFEIGHDVFLLLQNQQFYVVFQNGKLAVVIKMDPRKVFKNKKTGQTVAIIAHL